MSFTQGNSENTPRRVTSEPLQPHEAVTMTPLWSGDYRDMAAELSIPLLRRPNKSRHWLRHVDRGFLGCCDCRSQGLRAVRQEVK